MPKKKYDYVRKTFTYEGKRYTVRGKTEAEAYTKMGALQAVLKRDGQALGGSMTVSAWYTQWKDLYKSKTDITAKSLNAYDEKFNGYIKPTIGNMQLKDVREAHLQRILNGQAGKSFSHVSKIRMVMREMFSRARKSRLIIFDPAEDLILPQVCKGTHRSITDAERKVLLEVAETHRSGLWVLTLLYTGMRPGETAALCWEDINFSANHIHVCKALESGSSQIKAPKTPAGNRYIPIHATLRKKLWAVRGDASAPVFPTGAGNFQNVNSLRRLWTSFKREMDIAMGAELKRNKIVKSLIAPDLTPYCLRHTFCTDLEKAGVSLNVIKVLMGHSDISVTANIYTHTPDDLLHNAIAKLDGTASTKEKVKGT